VTPPPLKPCAHQGRLVFFPLFKHDTTSKPDAQAAGHLPCISNECCWWSRPTGASLGWVPSAPTQQPKQSKQEAAATPRHHCCCLWSATHARPLRLPPNHSLPASSLRRRHADYPVPNVPAETQQVDAAPAASPQVRFQFLPSTQRAPARLRCPCCSHCSCCELHLHPWALRVDP
jgi:hypothetical protein